MEALRCMCVVGLVLVSLQDVLVSGTNVLNACHVRCREEEQLKAACREERYCHSFLPDLDAFLTCLQPCADLGTNCFQRCAFKTDRISATCSRQCRVSDATGDVGSQVVPDSPGDVNSSGVSTSEGDTHVGTLCYKACYDAMLNAAMNRLYRKRP